MEKINLGWNEYFAQQFSPHKEKGFVPAKVISKHKNGYIVYLDREPVTARLAGKLHFKAQNRKALPVVGDWVYVHYLEHERQAIIQGVLGRKNSFARKAPISGGRKLRDGIIQGGATEEQIIVANIDTALIVAGLDGNFDLRRIERYITLVYNSGSKPVILLNKADLCTNVDARIAEVSGVAPGIPIYPISVVAGIGTEVFATYMQPGQTIVFLGSSGVGKSTIINYLFGDERQKTGLISTSTGKGKHTTTSVNLLFHPSGCMIVDTPGSRELQLWADEEALDESFRDIVELTWQCRYKDCRHDKEENCAVKQAIKDGLIQAERLESYKKQFMELEILDVRKKQLEMYLNRKAKRRL